MPEVRAALDGLIADKINIQAQLSASKSDMASVRGELLRNGEDPRHAQVQATASTDQEWRGRAVRAVMSIDAKIRRLNARVVDLTSGGAKQRPVGSPASRQAVAVTHRPLMELAEFAQSWLDDGWSLMQSIPHPDGLVLIMRNDFAAKGGGA
jgi:hypothetical protein